MGDPRHSGDRGAPAGVARDCAILTGLAATLDSPADSLHAQLARVVEGEILPRLMLAHRAAAVPARRPAVSRPSPEAITRFCARLLARDRRDATAEVLALLDEGLPLESLLLDLLTPAARHLGTLWEEDACDFVDVTLALGRLQAITRELCARLEDEAGPEDGRSILLLPCPGETHLYGLSMVASFFREAGWQVADARPGLDPCERVRGEWFDVVGLSLSCEVLLPAMAQAVRDLRAASRNPSIRVIVGGPHFARAPDDVHRVGADACAQDGRVAPAMAGNLLDMRARAC